MAIQTSQIFEGEIEELSAADLADLGRAVTALEHNSFIAKVGSLVGSQINLIGRFVPARFSKIAYGAANAALQAALHTAIRDLRRAPMVVDRAGDEARLQKRKTRLKRMAVASGVAGGAFGFTALAVELPVSTTLMLKAIAEIARHEGEDLTQPEALLACIEVFALGDKARAEASNAMLESSYFAVRSMLAGSVGEAAGFLARKGAINESAPALVRFLSQISARFGIVVGEKFAAQMVPLVGAAAGGSLNYAFADHYQRLAHGHFTVRRLERKYGRLMVQEAYERLAKKVKP
ncbi:MAG: EcsC family protein [Hyphomicrobiales bacterium]|nr:EcsC family protein [Hyphomicrobiales bacterium]MDE2113971.1 EcsC family protein [Hyphomicrobiales bacterium]